MLLCTRFKYASKQIGEVFPLWTRHLHLRRLVCSNGTICLTSEGISRGKEGHACSLKKESLETLGGKPVIYLRKPISTQQENSRFVVKSERWRRWKWREEEERGEFKTTCNTCHILSAVCALKSPDFSANNKVQLAQSRDTNTAYKSHYGLVWLVNLPAGAHEG